MPLHPRNTATFSRTKCNRDSSSQMRAASWARWRLLNLVCLFGLAFSGILSGTETIRFTNLSTLDGLPQGGVLSFEEDAVGFIWFGTNDGLRRFDGYEMNAYGSLAQMPATTSRTRHIAHDLLKTNQQQLVVSTGSGLRTLDLIRDSMHLRELSGFSARPSVLLQDAKSNVLFIGTSAGLYHWWPTTTLPEVVLSDLSISALAWAEGGNTLWIGTSQGQVLTWVPSAKEPPVTRWSCTSTITALQPTQNGKLWVGSADLGLYQLDEYQEVAHYLEHPDADSKVPSNRITTLLRDTRGQLWVGTKRGLAKYDPASQRFTVYQHDPSDSRSLGSNEVQSLYEGRRGVMWIGHRAGVSRFGLDETWFARYRHRAGDRLSLGHDSVFGMTTTPDDTLWIGTSGGLFAFKVTETGRARRATHPALLASTWNVSDVLGEDDGSLWIGTRDQGLQHWRPAASELTTFEAIPSKAITVLAQDGFGSTWVGTREGLAYGSLREGFKTLHHDPDNPGSLHSEVITALYSEPEGPLHVGTESGGVQVFDRNSMAFDDLHADLAGITPTVMIVDPHDHLWIGTLGHGVFMVDRQTERLVHYHTHNSSLPDNDIQGLLLDAKGTLWLSTGSGLANLAGQGHFRVFDTDDGLSSLTFHQNAFARDRAGRLYFGGDQGVAEINTDKLPEVKNVGMLQPILTGLEINGVKQQPSEHNPYLKKAIGSIKSLPLPFDRRARVGLTFATLNYTVPTRSQFRYRLVPMERTWTNAGKERRASYTGLRPGDYQFQVQSSLDGTHWNENSAVMEIRIPPPWYRTWWCMVGGALLSVGLVAGVIICFSRRRHQRALRQQEVLENERNKAEAALADELQRTMVLHSASETPDGEDDEDLYKVTLDRIVHYFGSSYGGIYKVDPESERLDVVCESYTSEKGTAGLIALEPNHSLVQDLITEVKPLIVSDVATDNRMGPWREALLTSGLEALLILPTMNQRKVCGLVIVGAEQPTAWRTEDIQLMETVASQIGRSMVHHQLLLAEQQNKLALESARRAAESANQAKSDFLAKMTHELRTPLNSIIGFTQLLEEDRAIDSEHRKTISIINSSGNHLLETVNGILDMSKIEQGQTEIHSEPFDLEPFIKEVLIMMRSRAESSGLTLIEERSTSLPTRIVTDKVKLRQILINFIGNSIKFTESGGITLRLKSLGHVKEDNALGYDHPLRLQFEVIDTGCGINEDEIPLLFESFAQTASGRQSGQGTGLGLPISKTFLELMGGQVNVKSDPGRGTTFVFDILCDDVPTAEATRPSSSKPVDGVPQLVAGSEPFRVLIAEDQLPNRLLLKTLLHKAGFEVIEAENGKQAVEKWRETNPDLIFMDNDMPFMTGLEATRAIVEEAPITEKPSIIFLSAFAIESYRQEALQAGCIDYLTKPFDKHDLFKVIVRHTRVEYC